ncbi:MAG: purine-nucleoside phosphorylase, partial [Longimicrobiales bacterium]
MPDIGAAVRVVRGRIGVEPVAGLILGSGLGSLADALDDAIAIPFDEIPGFLGATTAGHTGRLVAGRLEGVPVIAQQGRLHLYEGHEPAAVALPARLLARLGIRALLVTNAAGALDPLLAAGDLMILDDHINFMWRNPLIGAAGEDVPRFPDMSQPYDRALQAIADTVALQ